MRRSALLAVAGLGVLVSLLGGAVLFSALQDTARTGTNSAESAAVATSADIQLAAATKGGPGEPIICDTSFSENLASPLITVTGFSPGDLPTTAYFCVKNVGSQRVSISALADELTDVDFACTGDEAAQGDATCGGNQLGELSSVLQVAYTTWDCAGQSGAGQSPIILKDNATTPSGFPGPFFAPGSTSCFSAEVRYPSTTAAAAIQTAQTDRATWRFKFTAQA